MSRARRDEAAGPSITSFFAATKGGAGGAGISVKGGADGSADEATPLVAAKVVAARAGKRAHAMVHAATSSGRGGEPLAARGAAGTKRARSPESGAATGSPVRLAAGLPPTSAVSRAGAPLGVAAAAVTVSAGSTTPGAPAAAIVAIPAVGDGGDGDDDHGSDGDELRDVRGTAGAAATRPRPPPAAAAPWARAAESVGGETRAGSGGGGGGGGVGEADRPRYGVSSDVVDAEAAARRRLQAAVAAGAGRRDAMADRLRATVGAPDKLIGMFEALDALFNWRGREKPWMSFGEVAAHVTRESGRDFSTTELAQVVWGARVAFAVSGGEFVVRTRRKAGHTLAEPGHDGHAPHEYVVQRTPGGSMLNPRDRVRAFSDAIAHAAGGGVPAAELPHLPGVRAPASAAAVLAAHSVIESSRTARALAVVADRHAAAAAAAQDTAAGRAAQDTAAGRAAAVAQQQLPRPPPIAAQPYGEALRGVRPGLLEMVRARRLLLERGQAAEATVAAPERRLGSVLPTVAEKLWSIIPRNAAGVRVLGVRAVVEALLHSWRGASCERDMLARLEELAVHGCCEIFTQQSGERFVRIDAGTTLAGIQATLARAVDALLA